MNRDKLKARKKLKLLIVSARLGNVSEACRITGFSRDSYYRFKKLYEKGGEAALYDRKGNIPNIKNRVPVYIEEAVLALARAHPAYGKVKTASELKKQGIKISPGGVRNIWRRNNTGKVIKDRN